MANKKDKKGGKKKDRGLLRLVGIGRGESGPDGGPLHGRPAPQHSPDQTAKTVTAPTTPIGSAQQEAPPPIEGPLKAMVIMAHPDDAEFVCGGTVAKWCAEGWDVRYVLVTGGDKGTHDEAMHPEKLAAIREEEQRAACR